MANLTDMEELLHRIKNEQIKDYMREALTCYMTKAYRGCIVLSFIALFDDITSKLEKLAAINKVARNIYDEVKRRKDEQAVYENYLIDQLTAKNLLPEIDSVFAGILRELRNKSAHPSGHRPSAEEARYVFFEVIDRFLSKPIFSTSHLVDEILDRLKNSNFFVDIKIDKIGEVVQEEVSSLHMEAFPQLINKLINILDKQDDEIILKNAQCFINGLAALNQNEVNNNLKNIIVKAKSDNHSYNDLILETIYIQPIIFLNSDNITQARIKKVIAEKIKSSNLSLSQQQLRNPANVLVSISTIYSDKDFKDNFSETLEELFRRAPNFKLLSNLFKDKPLVFGKYLELIKSGLGSNSFDIANGFCEKVKGIEEVYLKYIDDKQSFEIITAISNSATVGAFKAESIMGTEFNSISATKNKAMKYIETHLDDAQEYFKSQVGKDLPDFLKPEQALN
ncbi:hypothetical protein SM168_12235 [Acinetobacter baumannii]|uniref:hypothetical protein n=1 Tax=Acinetobacter calcoaceticus/baumannii complex TaxID=909768 RepID=UPI000452164E|nr:MULTISPECIES: hypothetical protein [Acinetobacter calcoaceticus/baumannii complex]EXE78660.1 hypothetical protein J582_1052 [Acinetobacter sp. 1566109]MBJ9959471.1 hypothetical protein [Acinetobacter nosocomialis]MCU4344706.1 hypothetical protein [Acinetobacter pittii]MCU4354496.1 hypothetical protein [Acinetobacter pittii]MCZ3017481.1 hypothetical protein [Acinetobacter baumannii]